MFITSWLGEVRLWKMAGSITPTAREKFRKKTVIPKDPVETVGINKTSLPSPGSNCCFEENPHLKTRIRKPFWFRCILCPQCKRRLGGVLSTEDGDRCPQAWAFFRSWLLPGVLGTTWLTLGGRAFWSPWCTTQEKPVATMELCPVAPIRQNSLAGRGGWLGRTWSPSQPCCSLRQGVRRLLGTRTKSPS